MKDQDERPPGSKSRAEEQVCELEARIALKDEALERVAHERDQAFAALAEAGRRHARGDSEGVRLLLNDRIARESARQIVRDVQELGRLRELEAKVRWLADPIVGIRPSGESNACGALAYVGWFAAEVLAELAPPLAFIDWRPINAEIDDLRAKVDGALRERDVLRERLRRPDLSVDAFIEHVLATVGAAELPDLAGLRCVLEEAECFAKEQGASGG